MGLQVCLVGYSLVLPASDGFRIYTVFPPFSPAPYFRGALSCGHLYTDFRYGSTIRKAMRSQMTVFAVCGCVSGRSVMRSDYADDT